MQPQGKRRFGISMGPPSLEAPMVRLYLRAGCCEAPPTSTAMGNPITFCSIRLRVRPPSGTSARVRSPVVRTGQCCRLVILWFRPEYTATLCLRGRKRGAYRYSPGPVAPKQRIAYSTGDGPVGSDATCTMDCGDFERLRNWRDRNVEHAGVSSIVQNSDVRGVSIFRGLVCHHPARVIIFLEIY